MITTLDNIKDPVPIKITLVWTDYPGSPGAIKSLVNDLDLDVLDIKDSVSYVGNEALTGKKIPDRINNVEQVVIPHPATGRKFRIRVTGFNIPQGPQPFSLVVSGYVAAEPLLANIEEISNNSSVLITMILCIIFLVIVTIVACVYFRRKHGIPVFEGMPKLNLFGIRKVRKPLRTRDEEDDPDADEHHVFLPTQPVVQSREIAFDDDK